MNRSVLFAALACLVLAGCSATNYGPQKGAEGYAEQEVAPNVWRVMFFGNGHTTQETVQTYWLYRCAELTLDKGFDGFEVISPIVISLRDPFEKVQLAHHAAPVIMPIFVPGAAGAAPEAPALVAEVKLIKNPVTPVRGKVFNAVNVKSVLESPVKGPKCAKGNVCPFIHKYLDVAVEPASAG